MALEHINMDEIKEMEDIEQLHSKIEQVVKGQEITSKIMDKVLLKFEVTQFDPAGEKFDPNVHDAIYVIPASDQENDTVGKVIQTGWKIGDRVLRAAKVGIVKK